MAIEKREECAWCGAELCDLLTPERCANRRGEEFCTPWHRRASNAALRALLDSEGRRNGGKE